MGRFALYLYFHIFIKKFMNMDDGGIEWLCQPYIPHVRQRFKRPWRRSHFAACMYIDWSLHF